MKTPETQGRPGSLCLSVLLFLVCGGVVMAKPQEEGASNTAESSQATQSGDVKQHGSRDSWLAKSAAGDEAKDMEGTRLAALGGHAHAQCKLALCYLTGTGVPKDLGQALTWFRKASEQGLDEAQYLLGCCYNGEGGFEKQPAEAVRWWMEAASQGYADAQHCLGLSYAIGEGVGKDPEEAARWWRRAAEQNHAEAQYFLGLSYIEGLGVPKVPAQAEFWLGQAARQGNGNALVLLAKLGGTAQSRGR